MGYIPIRDVISGPPQQSAPLMKPEFIAPQEIDVHANIVPIVMDEEEDEGTLSCLQQGSSATISNNGDNKNTSVTTTHTY